MPVTSDSDDTPPGGMLGALLSGGDPSTVPNRRARTAAERHDADFDPAADKAVADQLAGRAEADARRAAARDNDLARALLAGRS
jgi:hypothetical protein